MSTIVTRAGKGSALTHAEVDANFTNLNTDKAELSGATFTGKVVIPATSTTAAGLNVPHGTAPTTPVNGDLWSTTTGLFLRTSGTTVQFATLTNTQTLANKTLTTPILNGLNYGVTSQT